MGGRIEIDLFTTLDGVVQAPGGPEEDPSGGFRYGGWQAPVTDATVGERVVEAIASMDALLLGRWTYEVFAGYWPRQLDGPAATIARALDAVPKYVVSRGRPQLPWRGSQLLGGDLAAGVAALRERHASTHVIGSATLARTLVRERLFDVLTLWTFPVVLGPGKRLFPDDGPAMRLALREPPLATGSGAVLLRYGPGGEVTTGAMGPD